MEREEKQTETAAEREQRYNEFVGLLARHDQSIRRFVRLLLPSRDGVDDVMQETALECWKKFADFTPDAPEKTVEEFIRWACVVARYKALSWQRDKGRDRLVFRENVIELLSVAAMSDLDVRELEWQAVEVCLSKMQDDQRRLVLSVYAPGQSIALIAAQTGEQARRLYSRLNALRKLLLDCVRQQLAEELGNG